MEFFQIFLTDYKFSSLWMIPFLKIRGWPARQCLGHQAMAGGEWLEDSL